MEKKDKIYVAGHTGVSGSAITEYLREKGYSNVITKTHAELDLIDSKKTEEFFNTERPDYVFFTAALPCNLAIHHLRADIFYKNTMMQTNVIHNAYKYGVKKMLYFSSVYMYPVSCPTPIKENSLLMGVPEYLCEPYALVKIAGTRMCEAYNIQYGTNFISVAPCNIYGDVGEFDLDKARVQYALLRKIHLGKLYQENNFDLLKKDLKIDSKDKIESYLNLHGITKDSVELWGDGTSRREFLHSHDIADACYFIMQKVNFDDLYNNKNSVIQNTHINIGTGKSYSIKELSEIITDIIGYKGKILFNAQKADNKTDRTMDCSRLFSLGWRPSISLYEGTKNMYEWYKKTIK